MVGGAVAVASSLLNLQPTMDELSKKSCNWENFNWDSQPGEQIKELFKKLERYPSQHSELLENMEDIKRHAQKSFDCVSQGIRSDCVNLYLLELDSTLKKNRIFEDLALCEGMLTIGSIFQDLVEDVRNLNEK